jgi:hypothetical protein
MALKQKTGFAGGVKVLDMAEGRVSALPAVTNVADSVNDRIMPGAISRSLKTRTPRVVAHHEWSQPVARIDQDKAVELMPGDPRLPADLIAIGAGALLIEAVFNLSTQRGKESFSDIAFMGAGSGSIGWSISYAIPPGGERINPSTGENEISAIDILTADPVLWGAQPLARTLAAKNARTTVGVADDHGSVLAAMKWWRESFGDVSVPVDVMLALLELECA